MKSWRKLFNIIIEYKKEHICAFLFLLLQSVASLCLPFVLIQIVDVGIEKQNYHILFLMGAIYVIITILYNFFKAISDYIYAKIGSKVIVNLRKKVLEHLSELSGDFYSNMKSGDIYSTITDDIGTIQELCTSAIFSTITNTAMAIPMIIFLIILDYRLFIVSILLQPIYALVQGRLGSSIGNHSQELRSSFGEYSSSLQEYLYSPINIEKNKATKYILSKILNFSKANAEILVKINFDFSKGQIYGNLMQNFSNILIIVIGGVLLINQQTTIGTILVYMQYAGKILTPVLGISQLNMKFKKAKISLDRILGLLETNSDVVYQIGINKEGISSGKIEFKNVSFGYVPDHFILRHIDLSIEPGKVTALVGGSGAGKTSIVNLLYRMWDVHNGKIAIDGINIIDYDIKYLRENISIVSQDIVLLNDTIYNNIVLGDSQIVLDDVVKATKIANIYDTIMNLDKQFETIIGDRGVKLSGGQKQRLAIAMALVRKSRIIVFDEATSALDNINELAIYKKIVELFKDRTILVIAHRLSTIEEADKIYVLDSGRIIESGVHKTLMKKQGFYYQLYKKEAKEKNKV